MRAVSCTPPDDAPADDKYKCNGFDCYFYDDLKQIEKMVTTAACCHAV